MLRLAIQFVLFNVAELPLSIQLRQMLLIALWPD